MREQDLRNAGAVRIVDSRTESLAEARIGVLRIVVRIAAAVACRDVERRPLHAQPAAVMNVARMRDGELNGIARLADHIGANLDRAVGRGGEYENATADNVERLGKAQHAAFAICGYIIDREHQLLRAGRGRQLPDPAGLLDDPDAIGIAVHRLDENRLIEASGDPLDADPLGTVGHRDLNVARRGDRSVAHRELNLVDVVAIAVGGKFEIRCREEAERTAQGDGEARRVGTARDRESEGISLGVGRQRLVGERCILDDARSACRSEDRRGIGGRGRRRRRRTAIVAAPAGCKTEKAKSGYNRAHLTGSAAGVVDTAECEACRGQVQCQTPGPFGPGASSVLKPADYEL